LALGKAGAQVLVHYGRAASEADTVINQIKSDGGRAHAIAGDLATAEGPEKLAFDVRRIVEDRLDVLVANAGISKLALIANRQRGLMAATPPGFGSSSAASIPMGSSRPRSRCRRGKPVRLRLKHIPRELQSNRISPAADCRFLAPSWRIA
jgi:NAD(P)-dependent dehydrogenase (short-subunit alcohol dehydrogenase family)